MKNLLLILFLMVTTLFAQNDAFKKIQDYADEQAKQGKIISTQKISKLLKKQNKLNKTQSIGDITFGTESNFSLNHPVTYIDVAVLDETHFVVAYTDEGPTNDDVQEGGAVRIGTVSATSISYGTAVEFTTNTLYSISVAALSSSRFIVAYDYFSSNYYAKVHIGNVSGSTITMDSAPIGVAGTALNFRNPKVAGISSTQFLVAYNHNTDSPYYGAKVVHGNYNSTEKSIAWGTGSAFYSTTSSDEQAHDINIEVLDPLASFPKFVVAYIANTDGNGKDAFARPGYVQSGSIHYGTELEFATGFVYTLSYDKFLDLTTLDTDHFLIAFTQNSITKCYYASTTTSAITSLKTETYISNSSPFVSVSGIDDKNFVISTSDENSSIGMIDGSNNISFKAASAFTTHESGHIANVALKNSSGDDKFVIAYESEDQDKGNTVHYGHARIGSIVGPLPVELISFTATASAGNVILNWNTATEVNNYGFEIERQFVTQIASNLSNEDWETIGFVEGHGNSNSPKNYEFTDPVLPNSSQLSYRLKQIDFDGKFEYSDVVEVEVALLQEYKLEQNYPNPFNPSTTISFALPRQANVKLNVYNSLGEEVAELINENISAGNHQVTFDASNLSSGLYFYRLNSANISETRKMMLIK